MSSEKQVGAFIGDGVVKLVQRALRISPKDSSMQRSRSFKHFYREHCLDHTRLYPGVLLTLKHFRRKKMAVVTNKPVRISGHLLEELGVSSYFEILIGGDSLPRKKPHPEPVLNALKTMRLQNPRRAVMVGDSPNDILAGRAAGTYTCGVRSNIGGPINLRNSMPDFAIGDIKGLMRIFR